MNQDLAFEKSSSGSYCCCCCCLSGPSHIVRVILGRDHKDSTDSRSSYVLPPSSLRHLTNPMEGNSHHGAHKSSQTDLASDWQQEWPALGEQIPGGKRNQRKAWKGDRTRTVPPHPPDPGGQHGAWRGDRARTVPPRPPEPGGLPSPSLGSTLLPHRVAPRRSLRHTNHPEVDEMVFLDTKGQPQYMWHTGRYGTPVLPEEDSDSDVTESPSEDETSSDTEREASSDEERRPLRRSLAGPKNPNWKLLFPDARTKDPQEPPEKKAHRILCLRTRIQSSARPRKGAEAQVKYGALEERATPTSGKQEVGHQEERVRLSLGPRLLSSGAMCKRALIVFLTLLYFGYSSTYSSSMTRTTGEMYYTAHSGQERLRTGNPLQAISLAASGLLAERKPPDRVNLLVGLRAATEALPESTEAMTEHGFVNKNILFVTVLNPTTSNILKFNSITLRGVLPPLTRLNLTVLTDQNSRLRCRGEPQLDRSQDRTLVSHQYGWRTVRFKPPTRKCRPPPSTRQRLKTPTPAAQVIGYTTAGVRNSQPELPVRTSPLPPWTQAELRQLQEEARRSQPYREPPKQTPATVTIEATEESIPEPITTTTRRNPRNLYRSLLLLLRGGIRGIYTGAYYYHYHAAESEDSIPEPSTTTTTRLAELWTSYNAQQMTVKFLQKSREAILAQPSTETNRVRYLSIILVFGQLCRTLTNIYS